MLAKLPLSLLSPAGPRGRLSILIFHRVLAQRDPLFPGEVDAADFDRICGWLRAMFNVLPYDDAVARLAAGTLPPRAACITFDDGYADNHALALPVLRRHGLQAIFFVATGFLDGGRVWNDTVIEALRRTPQGELDLRPLGIDGMGLVDLGSVAARRAAIDALLGRLKHRPLDERARLADAVAAAGGAKLPEDLMMRSEQVRALHAAGMSIGAHTVSHPILATLPTEQIRREVAESRTTLQDIVGEPIAHFAYPNGRPGHDYDARSVRIVRELGFDSAVSTAWGAARADTDRHELPRFSPWDRSPTRFGLRMTRNLLAA